MDNEKTTCPLTKLVCADDCAWALMFENGSWVCSVAAIAQVSVAETNPTPMAQIIEPYPGEEE